MQGDGEGEYAPGELLLIGAGMVEESAASAVDVRFAAVADGLDDLAPVAHDGLQLMKHTASGEPIAGLAEIVGCSVVAVLPDALLVEDLNEHVGTDGEGDAGVKEVACIDHDGGTAALGAERAKGVKEIFD